MRQLPFAPRQILHDRIDIAASHNRHAILHLRVRRQMNVAGHRSEADYRHTNHGTFDLSANRLYSGLFRRTLRDHIKRAVRVGKLAPTLLDFPASLEEFRAHSLRSPGFRIQ